MSEIEDQAAAAMSGKLSRQERLRMARPEPIPNDDPRWTNKVADFDSEAIIIPVPGGLGKMPKKGMCAECPFDKGSTPGFLGGWSPEAYAEAAQMPADLACHRSPGFHEGDLAKQHSCTGLAHFRANIEARVHPASKIAHTIEQCGKDPENVFETVEAFIEHHRKGT